MNDADFVIQYGLAVPPADGMATTITQFIWNRYYLDETVTGNSGSRTITDFVEGNEMDVEPRVWYLIRIIATCGTENVVAERMIQTADVIKAPATGTIRPGHRPPGARFLGQTLTANTTGMTYHDLPANLTKPRAY